MAFFDCQSGGTTTNNPHFVTLSNGFSSGTITFTQDYAIVYVVSYQAASGGTGANAPSRYGSELKSISYDGADSSGHASSGCWANVPKGATMPSPYYGKIFGIYYD